MSIMRPLLARGYSGDPYREQMLHEVIDALEDLGVKPGEFFEIVRPAELSSLSTKKLGPFVRDSETSRRAALDNYPRQGSQRRLIIEVLARSPATRDELQIRTGLSENSIRPRVLELIEGNWVEEIDRQRPTRSKSMATVLVLTTKAHLEHSSRWKERAS